MLTYVDLKSVATETHLAKVISEKVRQV